VLAELPTAFGGAGAIQVATPVETGRTGTPWAFVVTLPRDRVFAGVDDLRTNAILIAVSAVLVAVAAALIVGLESTGREMAEAANRAKSRFLANMNHELRTPLNAVIGFAEMIEKQMLGPIAPRYVDYAGEIRKSGQHLSSLVNDILDFSRIESGELRLAYEAVELRELVRDSIALVQAGMDCSGVALDNRVPAHLPALRADPQRLRQILVNLLTNAVKFSQRGGQVAVDARAEDAGVAIEVRDQGIGMGPEEVKRVTEPFVQLDAGLQRRHGGTGLGLSLVDRFVRLHGGRLAIRSAPGAGTTVTVRLPNPEADQEVLRRAG
jgi:signal transduction histidine kinase